MNMHSSIKMNVVHLWYIILDDFTDKHQELAHLLSIDEKKRSERFRFITHRQRFIIARAFLRKILSLYTKETPQQLIFLYNNHGKPYLKNNPLNLHFNVSHSHNIAVFAITIQKEIGVDIEKVELRFNEAIAKRFFTVEECQQLMALPEKERVVGFYKIWSRKEALIKALGAELYLLINKFTVNLHKNIELIQFNYHDQQAMFHVENIDLQKNYQCAIAIEKPLEHIQCWQWQKQGIISI